jgi:triacylglycerol esterase/lipase EstA (alpha/beta hydrolase family)
MLDLKTTLVAATISLSVGALGSWYLTAEYKDASWAASIEKQKVEAAGQLQTATDRAISAERRQNELATQLEVKHVESEKELDKALSTNRRLDRELGGLRDPGRRPSCGGTVPADSTTTAKPETGPIGTELSAEASEFLLEFAHDADRAAQYAKTCYDWAQQLNRE